MEAALIKGRLSDTKTFQVFFQTSDRKPLRLPLRLQRENINMLSYFLTYSILLSTDVRRSPFLSRTGNVLHAFYLQSFCVLSFYKKTFRFTPAICKDCTVPSRRLADL